MPIARQDQQKPIEIHVDDVAHRQQQTTPPDGGYGWVCVGACFTTNCFTWGAVSAYGIYLSHYLADDIFPEASSWDFAFIGGFNFSIAMLVAPLVTVLCSGFIAASFATRIWQLHLTQGVLIGAGIGFLYIPSLPILSQWFVKKRGLANGISAAGSGVGGVAFTWGSQAMIQHISIAWSLRITGILAFVAILAAISVIRDRNHVIRPPQLAFDLKLLRRVDVLLLLAVKEWEWHFARVFGAPTPDKLETRAVVNHDSLSPIPTRLQGGNIGRAIQMFSPLLHIAHGCQPYTAADDAGNVSGGLQDTGNVSAGCRDPNKGQTYARAAWHKGKFGIMYAWYFPKDQPNAGNVVGGHRHDWENIVVWIDNPDNASPRILGGAASGHGSYKRTNNPNRQGNNVKVEYFTRFPTNHELQFTDTTGRSYWISDWDAMPAAEKNALATANFGNANVPFKPDNFMSNLDKAFV
ncbi:hypothetical protein E8E13_010211 [Curvularia kusanoi]|uniref:Uncharacterized protein n=1 Tax=Curvularia kusanoi TaxID=90978 RepID=A0A9P4THK8_CURKU|nr:hypothetical protein E8E13_010211 [Curvularia kusanoi]